MLQFPVGEEIGKIGRAMPHNGKPVDGDIIPCQLMSLLSGRLPGGVPMRVMVTKTKEAGEEEENGKGGKSNGDGKERGKCDQQQ
jgi:hypothetical protein